jgi:membrane protein implicated in regulation of membrane protease activity
MQPYVWWFLLALGVLGLELLTGTFYMLVFSIALSAGGFMALWRFDFTPQLVVAAIIGVAGTLLLRAWKTAHSQQDIPTNQNLDIGQRVTVESWRENGSARVTYRGTQWDAELDSPDTPRNVPLYIKDRRGSVLILSQHKPV